MVLPIIRRYTNNQITLADYSYSPSDLGHESACMLLYFTPTATVHFSAQKLILLFHRVEGWIGLTLQ